jgi:hypothetical protein
VTWNVIVEGSERAIETIRQRFSDITAEEHSSFLASNYPEIVRFFKMSNVRSRYI